jgi:hypothetical protein
MPFLASSFRLEPTTIFHLLARIAIKWLRFSPNDDADRDDQGSAIIVRSHPGVVASASLKLDGANVQG